MSQGSYNVPTGGSYSMVTFSGLMNAAYNALATQSSGASVPANGPSSAPQEFQTWFDTTNVNFPALKVFDGTNWDRIGTLDVANSIWNPQLGGGIISVASAATVNLGAQSQTFISITGAATITSFGSSAKNGEMKFVYANGAFQITNSSNIICPFGTNITTVVGNTFIAIYNGAGQWVVTNYVGGARSVVSYTPTFDIGGGPHFYATAIELTSPTSVTVPANDSFSYIGIPTNATNNQVTLGAGATAAGIWSNMEALSGSDSTSNIYGGIFFAQNDGPGTTKGIHVFSSASGSSSGAVYGGAFECTPISTTSNAACVQASLIGNGGDGLAVGYTINSNGPGGVGAGNQFIHGVGTIIGPIPIKVSFYQAWMATNSAANARAFTTFQNDGTEIQYIKKTGEVVSSTGLIGGTEANGTNLTQVALTRNASNGNLAIAAGSSTGILQLQAGGNTGMTVNSDGSVTFATATSFSSLGSVATALTSVGPTGSHATVQEWLTIKDNNGTTRYIPCF